MIRALALFALLLPLATGCHAKFKKEAPTLGEVRVQMVTTGGPYVQLGQVDVPQQNPLAAVAAVAVNVAQAVRGADLQERIAQAVDVDDVNHAFDEGVATTLDAGPPFAWTDRKDANATMQVEVLSYGLFVPYLGAPGVFTYDLRVRIYKKDGDRVYTTHHDCAVGAGTPGVGEVVLGIVDNVRQIDQMSDAQINDAFSTMARWCAQSFVVKMRRHAG